MKELFKPDVEKKQEKEVELQNVKDKIEKIESDTKGKELQVTPYTFVTLSKEENARIAIDRLSIGVLKRVLTRFGCDCFRKYAFKRR